MLFKQSSVVGNPDVEQFISQPPDAELHSKVLLAIAGGVCMQVTSGAKTNLQKTRQSTQYRPVDGEGSAVGVGVLRLGVGVLMGGPPGLEVSPATYCSTSAESRLSV